MMATEYAGNSSAVFEQFRGRLFAVAYRMTGPRPRTQSVFGRRKAAGAAWASPIIF